MTITHEDLKKQIENAKYHQRISDEKDFVKKEQHQRDFYEEQIKNIQKSHITKLKQVYAEHEQDLKEEGFKRIQKYKSLLVEKNQIISELKEEIVRLRCRNRKLEKAHVITHSLRNILLVTIDRLQGYYTMLDSSKLAIYQALSKMHDELDFQIQKIKRKEDVINEIMLPEEADIEEILSTVVIEKT